MMAFCWSFKWTDERVALLKKRWLEGVRTQQIATELGCTGNAVIGKANRLGFGLHPGKFCLSTGDKSSSRRVGVTSTTV